MSNKLSEKLAYKRNIKNYLEELAKLTNMRPTEDNLLSLKITNDIRENAKKLAVYPAVRISMPFQDKLSNRFSNFINDLYKKNPSEIYIWTNHTNSCGALKLESILMFNFTFQFDVNNDGIIVILANNYQDKITFDFYKNKEDKEMLDIDLRGENWGYIRF